MAEPRARVRQKGQVFSSDDRKSTFNTTYQNRFKKARPNNHSPVSSLLVAFGDHPPPLPGTISALDEILTDFIIETCHYAALSASYSRRQKIKSDDFKFVLRRDEVLLGRVQEQLWRERKLKEDRKMVDTNEDLKTMAKGEEEEEGGAGEGKKTKRGRKKKGGEKEEGEREGKRRKSG
jgi:transcription initiation factor TFIID subunit 13